MIRENSTIPKTLLDYEGYPTEEWLQFIRDYKPDEEIPITGFVEILSRGWHLSDWGFKLHKPYNGKRKLELHTGGWSGNEEIIREILSNIYLTHFYMNYTMWKSGGHYYFEVNLKTA